MTRYIDADALLENLKKQYGEELGWQVTVNMTDVGMMIEDAPTADVAEVVRCKDCKFKTVTSDGEYNPEDIVCEYFMSDGFRETDFCSYGERME